MTDGRRTKTEHNSSPSWHSWVNLCEVILNLGQQLSRSFYYDFCLPVCSAEWKRQCNTDRGLQVTIVSNYLEFGPVVHEEFI